MTKLPQCMRPSGIAAAAVLCGLCALDEFSAGVLPLSAAEIRDELDLAYTGLATSILVVPLLLALCVEGPLLLFSDRWPRKPLTVGSIAVMGVCLLVAGNSESVWGLATMFGLWAGIGGLASNLVKGVLMDAYPQAREQWMTRWTLAGTLGDAVTPLLVIAVAQFGWGWRVGLGVAGGLHFVHASSLMFVSFPARDGVKEGTDNDEQDENRFSGWRASWRSFLAGIRDVELVAWLGASAACALLDEILVAFGMLFLREELTLTTTERAAAFAWCSAGAVIGLFLTDCLLRSVAPLRLLIASCLACAVTYFAWLVTRDHLLSVVALVGVGLFAAPLYPIASARAYALRPGQPGLVAAVDQIFAPFAFLAPLVVGFIADQWGVVRALAILLLQPVVVGFVAVWAVWRSKSRLSEKAIHD